MNVVGHVIDNSIYIQMVIACICAFLHIKGYVSIRIPRAFKIMCLWNIFVFCYDLLESRDLLINGFIVVWNIAWAWYYDRCDDDDEPRGGKRQKVQSIPMEAQLQT